MIGWAAALLAAAGTVAAEPDGFGACDVAVAREPARYDSYLCYFLAGERSKRLSDAAVRLDRLRVEGRGGGWAVLVRGHVAASASEGAPRTIELYREAAHLLSAEHQALGEVIARTNLRRLYLDRGDRAAADAEVEQGLRAARDGGDREALVRASILEASHLTDLGQDLGRAHRALRRAEAAAFPDGPPGLQQSVLRRFANLSYQLGRYGEAAEKLERLLAATRALGNSGGAALHYNLLNVRRTEREARPVEGALAEVRALAEEALSSARREGDAAIEARTHAALAELLAVQEPDAAAGHTRRCLELARGLDRRLPELDCLSAEALQQTDPARAERALARAEGIAAAEGDLLSTYVSHARLRTVWRRRPREEATREALRALDAFERVRGAQVDPEARIRVLANWAKDYHWLAGRLLAAEPSDAASAFGVMERLRARALLEGLDAAGVAGARPGAEAMDAARTAIAHVQRRLLDPALGGRARQDLLAELERRELDEAELSSRAAPLATLDRARLVTLDDVHGRLREGEALLTFSVGLERGLDGADEGGSWALLVTRSAETAWRVPDRLRLEAAVPLLCGLLERRDGSEARLAVALHRALFGGAGGALDAGIRRLVIVPDGVLHELPFAALRPAPEAAPLGVRHEIALVPSATLWARWRGRTPARTRGAALVLADPEAIAQAPLPAARSEGRRVHRAVGGGSRLLLGAQGSEAALKSADLAGFGVLHFASHAVADDAYPDRSAVVLAPGADGEDGLLQPREIAELDLADRAVVLSACRGASGPVASPEGVLSLARAFFQAGARTVVAGRSRLRDDEAERFFRWFYDGLRGGQTMGAALRTARARAVAAGLPAATWAGVDLLGDADVALELVPPAPAGSRRAAAVMTLLALALAAWGAARFVRG